MCNKRNECFVWFEVGKNRLSYQIFCHIMNLSRSLDGLVLYKNKKLLIFYFIFISRKGQLLIIPNWFDVKILQNESKLVVLALHVSKILHFKKYSNYTLKCAEKCSHMFLRLKYD